MATGIERRQYGRVHLLAHGRNKTCTLEFSGQSSRAELIDISAGGARVRCSPPRPGDDVRDVVVCVQAVNDNGLLQQLQSEIRWRDGAEYGLQFVYPLQVGLRTLQELVG
ncbi:PilZ domain-containing protein [Humidesulfovibrio mexicanus]|uniref:PilZ domain-containing protein n=1 Tax=Humidesulfovibrio mexicanus TaxID=147047 RepID=A0A238YCH5_9BACT|nr:PilZ domain-containing protein [Humidesulfovibrio mexicanus]SNR68672.1 PilZ domain-containing protein [Humidesulfovibrio mexicanus]